MSLNSFMPKDIFNCDNYLSQLNNVKHKIFEILNNPILVELKRSQEELRKNVIPLLFFNIFFSTEKSLINDLVKFLGDSDKLSLVEVHPRIKFFTKNLLLEDEYDCCDISDPIHAQMVTRYLMCQIDDLDYLHGFIQILNIFKFQNLKYINFENFFDSNLLLKYMNTFKIVIKNRDISDTDNMKLISDEKNQLEDEEDMTEIKFDPTKDQIITIKNILDMVKKNKSIEHICFSNERVNSTNERLLQQFLKIPTLKRIEIIGVDNHNYFSLESLGEFCDKEIIVHHKISMDKSSSVLCKSLDKIKILKKLTININYYQKIWNLQCLIIPNTLIRNLYIQKGNNCGAVFLKEYINNIIEKNQNIENLVIISYDEGIYFYYISDILKKLNHNTMIKTLTLKVESIFNCIEVMSKNLNDSKSVLPDQEIKTLVINNKILEKIIFEDISGNKRIIEIKEEKEEK